MKLSSMVLSTADKEPGMSDLATAIAPFLRSSEAPGWLSSIFVRKTSNQERYLEMR